MHFDSAVLTLLRIDLKFEIVAQDIIYLRIIEQVSSLLHFCMDCDPFLTLILSHLDGFWFMSSLGDWFETWNTSLLSYKEIVYM